MSILVRLRHWFGSFRAWLKGRWKWPTLSAALAGFGWIAFSSIEIAGLILMGVPAVDVLWRRAREPSDRCDAGDRLPGAYAHDRDRESRPGFDGHVNDNAFQDGAREHADAKPTTAIPPPVASPKAFEYEGRSEADWQHVASAAGATVAVIAVGRAFSKLAPREQQAVLLVLLVAIAVMLAWAHLGAARRPRSAPVGVAQ